MKSNIRKFVTMFAAVSLIAGLLSIAPIQSSHAALIDVTDFGCVGVNNCTVENNCPTESKQTNGLALNSTNTAEIIIGGCPFTIVP